MHGDTSWHWEARSVNGRNLDLRLRLPSGFDGLEIRARSLAQEKLARGNCTINLWVKRESGQMEIRLNEAALRQAQAVAERAQDLTGLKPPRLDTLLGMRGVVETVEGEESEEAQAALNHALIASLAAALDQLVSARAAEGAASDRDREAACAMEAWSRRRGAAPGNPRRSLTPWRADRPPTEPGSGLDPERLHQEALLFAAKADIQEGSTLARPCRGSQRAHRERPAGRAQIRILAQEFNRRRTRCARKLPTSRSATGLELKTVIDQLREQVQNIE
jgi:uncharacterized protein YicC (UPF0701 family)